MISSKPKDATEQAVVPFQAATVHAPLYQVSPVLPLWQANGDGGVQKCAGEVRGYLPVMFHMHSVLIVCLR